MTRSANNTDYYSSSEEDDDSRRHDQRHKDDALEDGGVEVPYGQSKLQDQEAPSSSRSVANYLRSMPKKKKRNFLGGGCCCFLVVAGLILIILFVVVLEGDPNNFQVPAAWNEIFDSDPFEAKPPEESMRWYNSGNGLNIQVINALDGRWHPYFDKSIQDWDNGYPDSLEISTNVGTPESECTHSRNIIKVCNSNYGETPWKGRAEILSDKQTGTIFAATARMNDFYLSERNTDEMQYAMCHELGHTFGLHHTDENFYNRDLGNCMDYTNKHRNNLTPDQSNYEFLHALYGLVPGSEPFQAPTSAPVVGQVSSPAPSPFTNTNGGSGFPNNGFDPNNGGNNGGWRPPQEDEKEMEKEKDKKEKDDRKLEEFPDWLLKAIQEAREHEIEGDSDSLELSGGFVLHIHHFNI